MKLKDVAHAVNGELIGPPPAGDIEISGASGISDARGGDITFLADRKLLKELAGTRAAAVLVKDVVEGLQKPQVKTKNPLYAFAKLLALFHVKPLPRKGISANAFVSGQASLGSEVSVYDFAYIADGVKVGSRCVIHPGVFIGENSVVGDDCVIYPNVTIREGVAVGNRVVIHPGSVIGSDGFGYVYEEGAHQKIPQVGGVIIEDDVEIGSNVTIDRATTGNTVVGRGTKIDNLVQIAHNVHIGQHVILVAQVGIGGSCHIGDGVILGGQVGVADHTQIDAGTMIGAKSGVLGHVQRGIYSGAPIMPHRDWLKASAVFARLPEMKKKIEELEKRIGSIEDGK